MISNIDGTSVIHLTAETAHGNNVAMPNLFGGQIISTLKAASAAYRCDHNIITDAVAHSAFDTHTHADAA